MCVCIFSCSDVLEQFARALLTLGKAHFLNERFLYMHKTCLKASLEVHIFYIYAFRWVFFFYCKSPGVVCWVICISQVVCGVPVTFCSTLHPTAGLHEVLGSQHLSGACGHSSYYKKSQARCSSEPLLLNSCLPELILYHSFIKTMFLLM